MWQDEQNRKHIHGEGTSSCNITRTGPRIANKSGRSVSNKLGVSRGVYFEQWMPRPSVTVLASTRLVERIRFCESTSTVVRDENLLRG